MSLASCSFEPVWSRSSEGWSWRSCSGAGCEEVLSGAKLSSLFETWSVMTINSSRDRGGIGECMLSGDRTENGVVGPPLSVAQS